jgi:hypothetical protein
MIATEDPAPLPTSLSSFGSFRLGSPGWPKMGISLAEEIFREIPGVRREIPPSVPPGMRNFRLRWAEGNSNPLLV